MGALIDEKHSYFFVVKQVTKRLHKFEKQENRNVEDWTMEELDQ